MYSYLWLQSSKPRFLVCYVCMYVCMYIAGRSSQCTRGWAGTRSHYSTQDWGEILRSLPYLVFIWLQLHTHTHSLFTQKEIDLESNSYIERSVAQFYDEKKEFPGTNPILIHTWTVFRYAPHASLAPMYISSYIHIFIYTYIHSSYFIYYFVLGIMFHGFFLWWEIGLLDWDGRYSMYINTSKHTYTH